MRLFGRIVVIILAVVGALTVVGTIAFSIILAHALSDLGVRPGKSEPLPAHMVLSIDLDAGVAEAPPGLGAVFLGGGGKALVLSQVAQTLDRASSDPRVTAIVARLSGGAKGMAATQEIRDAVAEFRKSGKRSVLFSEDLGGSTVAVYLASAFQEVWLQPSGSYGLLGFSIQSPFIKGTLDMLGIEPQFSGRWQYKSFIETFTRDSASKENRDTLDALAQAWTHQVVEGIASARGLKADDVRALMDKGMLLPEEARQAGLVDHLGYWDEVDTSLVKDGAKLVDFNAYAAQLDPQPEAVKVALIVGTGEVVSKSEDNGDAPIAASRITAAFRDAVKDPQVKAILFRIDSPGGSYSASDTIWRAVSNARAAGKPVVVSMGDVAASGGYFSAMAADRVIAEPGTITGSIGIFGGKFVLADFWKKLGVNWDGVHQGQNADMDSFNQAYSPAGWERLNAFLDHAYADFTDKAAKARKLTPEQIDAVARGRVWAGDKAKEVGLVDDNGGYPEAFAAIRQLARLPSHMPLELERFPQPTREQQLLEFVRSGVAPGTTLAVEARVAAALQPFAFLLTRGDSTLRMPPFQAQ